MAPNNFLPMRTIQFREALNEAMSEEMRRGPNVVLMGEEVGENGEQRHAGGIRC